MKNVLNQKSSHIPRYKNIKISDLKKEKVKWNANLNVMINMYKMFFLIFYFPHTL